MNHKQNWSDDRDLHSQHIHYNIDTIVSKNSGGNATYAKIVTARELEIPVVMVQRSTPPPVEQVADIEGAICWLLDRLVDVQ